MKFSIIYSVDGPEDEDITRYAPPDLESWDETEGDDQYEYSYLEGCGETAVIGSGVRFLNVSNSMNSSNTAAY